HAHAGGEEDRVQLHVRRVASPARVAEEDHARTRRGGGDLCPRGPERLPDGRAALVAPDRPAAAEEVVALHLRRTEGRAPVQLEPSQQIERKRGGATQGQLRLGEAEAPGGAEKRSRSLTAPSGRIGADAPGQRQLPADLFRLLRREVGTEILLS